MNTRNQSWHMHNDLYKSDCYIAENFFPTVLTLIGYLCYMTFNNEIVSRQNLLAVNIAKSMTSDGNSALFPRMLTVDRRYSEI